MAEETSWQSAPLLQRTVLLAAGSAGGQVIILAATPLLARAYGPSALGAYAAFAAIASVLCVIPCMRYEIEIAQGNLNELSTRVLVALLAAFVMAAACSLILLAGGAEFLEHIVALGNSAWLLPLVLLLGGVAQIGTYISVRRGSFLPIVFFRLVNPALFVSAALLLPAAGLAQAHVIGLSSALLFLCIYHSKIGSQFIGAIKLGWRLRHIPKRLMPAAAMDACAVSLPVIFVGAFYGASEAGNFSQIQRLVVGPILIVSIAAGYVLHSESARIIRSGAQLMPLVRRALLGLCGIAAVWLISAIAAGPSILYMLLGSEWRTERIFIVTILLAYIIRVIAAPLSTILLTLGHHRIIFIWQGTLFLWSAAFIPAIAKSTPFETFLAVFAIVESIFYICYLVLAVSSAISHDRFCSSNRGQPS